MVVVVVIATLCHVLGKEMLGFDIHVQHPFKEIISLGLGTHLRCDVAQVVIKTRGIDCGFGIGRGCGCCSRTGFVLTINLILGGGGSGSCRCGMMIG